MKKLINYLDLFKKSTPSFGVRVSIDWSKAISVNDIKTDNLTLLERILVTRNDVIYIFVGENSQGEKGIDIGQTSKSLIERTKEHLQIGDFLEGYLLNQSIYCGKVSANVGVDRDLLEQVEGMIIQGINRQATKLGYTVCNDTKLDGYKSYYKIMNVCNKSMSEELTEVLPYIL